MRFIINASILDVKPTGIGIYTINVLKQFNAKGLPYTLFSSMDDLGQKSLIKLPKWCRPFPYKKPGGMFRFVVNQFYFTLVANKFDVAYLPTPHGSLFLRNQVVTVHDLLALRFPSQHKLQYYYYKFFLNQILKKAKGIVAISEATKSDLLSFYDLDPNKIKVIHNGFDSTLFSYKESAASYIDTKFGLSNYIFTVGSSYPHKNIDRLIEAFLMSSSSSDTQLVITGHIGENQKALMEKYQASNVKYIGFVESSDLPYLYSAAECMVYPSLYEGFGFPPLEAMNCHCPVITSNISSLPEVCGDAVQYVDPYDTSSIARAIDKVIADDSFRSQLVVKGLERVQLFNWESTASDIAEYIKGVRS